MPDILVRISSLRPRRSPVMRMSLSRVVPPVMRTVPLPCVPTVALLLLAHPAARVAGVFLLQAVAERGDLRPGKRSVEISKARACAR